MCQQHSIDKNDIYCFYPIHLLEMFLLKVEFEVTMSYKVMFFLMMAFSNSSILNSYNSYK